MPAPGGLPRRGRRRRSSPSQVDRDALLPVADALPLHRPRRRRRLRDRASARPGRRCSSPATACILGPSLACGTFGGAVPARVQAHPRRLPPVPVPAHRVRRRLHARRCARPGRSRSASPTDPVSRHGRRRRGPRRARTRHHRRRHPGPARPRAARARPDHRSSPLEALTLGHVAPHGRQRHQPHEPAHRRRAAWWSTPRPTLSGRAPGRRPRPHRRDPLGVARHRRRRRARARPTATLEVSGVTVGGVPAQITEDGLVLGEPAGGLGPLLAAAADASSTSCSRALGVHGRRARQRGDHAITDGQAVASVGGLLIEIAVPARRPPDHPRAARRHRPERPLRRRRIQLGATGGARRRRQLRP